METKTNKRPEPCIICDGKYELGMVAITPTNEPVCKEHIEQIIEYLREKREREADSIDTQELLTCSKCGDKMREGDEENGLCPDCQGEEEEFREELEVKE